MTYIVDTKWYPFPEWNFELAEDGVGQIAYFVGEAFITRERCCGYAGASTANWTWVMVCVSDRTNQNSLLKANCCFGFFSIFLIA